VSHRAVSHRAVSHRAVSHGAVSHLLLDEVDDVLQVQVFSIADHSSQHQLLRPQDHLINDRSRDQSQHGIN